MSFCMMELRWPEVRAAAETEIASGDPRNFSEAWEVLDVYEGNWAGYDLFDTYPAPAQPV